jgi:hypothetical protein
VALAEAPPALDAGPPPAAPATPAGFVEVVVPEPAAPEAGMLVAVMGGDIPVDLTPDAPAPPALAGAFAPALPAADGGLVTTAPVPAVGCDFAVAGAAVAAGAGDPHATVQSTSTDQDEWVLRISSIGTHGIACRSRRRIHRARHQLFRSRQCSASDQLSHFSAEATERTLAVSAKSSIQISSSVTQATAVWPPWTERPAPPFHPCSRGASVAPLSAAPLMLPVLCLFLERPKVMKPSRTSYLAIGKRRISLSISALEVPRVTSCLEPRSMVHAQYSLSYSTQRSQTGSLRITPLVYGT